MSQLNTYDFVDLYLTRDCLEDGTKVDKAFFKGLKGADQILTPVPEELLPELNILRNTCKATRLHEKTPEFFLNQAGVKYRVRAEKNIWNQERYTLRKLALNVKHLESIGFTTEVNHMLMRPDLKGLVLIAGETGAGKTSTAAALIYSRLLKHGGFAVAIEDPPEINMHGPHGHGWCEQVPASRFTGGYKEHLVGSLRDNPDMILLGEVRDEATANEVVNASCNGHFILSTIHADSIPTAVDRISGLAGTGSGLGVGPTNSKLAMGLKAVIWQSLERRADGAGYQFTWQSLNLMGDENNGVRARIREGKFAHLAQDIDQQANRMKRVA